MKQTIPCRAIRGDSISINSILSPSLKGDAHHAPLGPLRRGRARGRSQHRRPPGAPVQEGRLPPAGLDIIIIIIIIIGTIINTMISMFVTTQTTNHIIIIIIVIIPVPYNIYIYIYI